MYKPIIPWVGGKRRLAKHILPLIGNPETYVEPFAGGAAIFFLKQPSKIEVINDINSDLVNLYRVVQHHLEELIRHFKWTLISRESFLNHQKTDSSVLTDVQRAAQFYYLQRMAFGGKVTGQSFGTAATTPPGFNLLRIEEDLSQAHMRLSRVYIENLPWDKIIGKYDKNQTMFYLDPPYYATEGYGLEFGLEQYEQMASLAGKIKGRMLISVNNIPKMRTTFKNLNQDSIPINHTLPKGKAAKRSELLIRNW